jgi:hypothetical protein
MLQDEVPMLLLILLIAVVGLADWGAQRTLLALLPAEVVCQEGGQF